MFFNNVMNSRYYGISNSLSTGNTAGTYNKSGNISKTRNMSFGSTLQNQRVNQMKQEIYDKFQIEVGNSSGRISCYIPSTVLAQMNTNQALKTKVFQSLEKITGEEFQKTIMGQESEIKKCTMIFDEKGEMTATLENGTQTQGRLGQSAWLLYQKSLMQQAALMPYQMNLYNSYSGYPNLYGISGLNGISGQSGMNYSALLQNAIFSSMFGKMF